MTKIEQQELKTALLRIAELEKEVERLTGELNMYEADEYNRQIDQFRCDDSDT